MVSLIICGGWVSRIKGGFISDRHGSYLIASTWTQPIRAKVWTVQFGTLVQAPMDGYQYLRWKAEL